MARLILDTCVLIAGARDRVDLTALADTDDVAVPTVAVAKHHAALLAHTYRTGKGRGVHDLIIGARARTERPTHDRFDELVPTASEVLPFDR